MEPPLVSVICVCFNHDRFVGEAVLSVISQTWKNIEIIIVDDASTDRSAEVIRRLVGAYPFIKFIQLHENKGNCFAFNAGLKECKGSFIVDLSADDVFYPERIEKQLSYFRLFPDTGVVFTDAVYIDGNGNPLREHFGWLKKNRLLPIVPEGEVYREVLSRYFISSPTMLVRREVFDVIGGYDETLAYEDFDFWVRSARHFPYRCIHEVLTKVRKVQGSLSSRAYLRDDRQLESTYRVCVKAKSLNRNASEDAALAARVRYELRHAVFTGNLREAELFYTLLNDVTTARLSDRLIIALGRTGLPLLWIRRWYHRVRYM